MALVQYKPKINNFYFVLFIQMQLYESKTLKDWLEKENRQVDRIKNLNIFKQIVEGLDHIHNKKIIHRDVKPGNIFIANDGTVKVKRNFEAVGNW
jgi:serine/threonine protein kinase